MVKLIGLVGLVVLILNCNAAGANANANANANSDAVAAVSATAENEAETETDADGAAMEAWFIEHMSVEIERVRIEVDELLRSKSLAELEEELVPKLRRTALSADDVEAQFEAECMLYELSLRIRDEFSGLPTTGEAPLGWISTGHLLIKEGRIKQGLEVLFREARMQQEFALDALLTIYFRGAYELEDGTSVEVAEKHDPRILELYKTLLDEGSPYAKEFIGLVLINGAGLPQDEARGFRLLEESGFPETMMFLGNHYLFEKKDIEKAKYWYRRLAVEYDDAEAWHRLSRISYNNDEFEEAARLCRKALECDPDYCPPLIDLACMYIYGLDVGVDLDHAETLLRRILKVEKEDLYVRAMAECNLGAVAIVRREPPRPSSEELKAEFEKTKAAAETGDVEAMVELGQMYRDGRGVEKNQRLSNEWCLKAAESGNAHAVYLIGLERLDGSSSAEEAMTWFKRAADAGNTDAMHALADILDDDQYPEHDKDKAFDWYLKAAKLGHAESMFSVAVRFYWTESGQQNVQKAIYWARKAVLNNEFKGLIALAALCMDESLEEPDVLESYVLMSLAIRFGEIDLYELRAHITSDFTPEQFERGNAIVEERMDAYIQTGKLPLPEVQDSGKRNLQ